MCDGLPTRIWANPIFYHFGLQKFSNAESRAESKLIANVVE